MKKLTCEMCGSNDLIKQDGVFVCQYCGTKYTVEEAKRMMIDGTVDVQGTVKVDVSDKVKNLYEMARRAKDAGDSASAAKYYEMIAFENPHDWESLFYYNYFKAFKTNLRDMEGSLMVLSNSLNGVFNLIDESDKTPDEKWDIAKEIAARIISFGNTCLSLAGDHYMKFSDVSGALSDLISQKKAVAELKNNTIALLKKHFPEHEAELTTTNNKASNSKSNSKLETATHICTFISFFVFLIPLNVLLYIQLMDYVGKELGIFLSAIMIVISYLADYLIWKKICNKIYSKYISDKSEK